jgi:TRAP-type C4-dicarboxylate transport system permease small subunit
LSAEADVRPNFFGREGDGLIKGIPKLLDRMNRVVNSIAVLSLTLCVSAAIINVAARYVFSHPFRWSEEFCVITLIWMVYCSLPVLEQQNEHLNMTALYNYFPPKLKLSVNVLCSLTAMVIAAFVIRASVKVVMRNYSIKINTQVFDWPYWIVYLAIPLAFTLIFLTRLDDLRKTVGCRGDGSSSQAEKEGKAI